MQLKNKTTFWVAKMLRKYSSYGVLLRTYDILLLNYNSYHITFYNDYVFKNGSNKL